MPVDAYGVGSSVHDGRWDFTADVVRLDGEPQAQARAGVPAERPKLREGEVDAPHVDLTAAPVHGLTVVPWQVRRSTAPASRR